MFPPLGQVALARIVLFASRIYTNETVGPLVSNIPNNINRAEIEVDVTAHTNPATRWVVVVDLSLDGGATWILNWFGAGRIGGIVNDRVTGLPLVVAGPFRDLPRVNGRRVRATFTVAGTVVLSGTLVTS